MGHSFGGSGGRGALEENLSAVADADADAYADADFSLAIVNVDKLTSESRSDETVSSVNTDALCHRLLSIQLEVPNRDSHMVMVTAHGRSTRLIAYHSSHSICVFSIFGVRNKLC